MSICVTGANGMLGHAVQRALAQAGSSVTAIVEDIGHIQMHHLQGAAVVINCAGLVKQREAPDSEFMRVNAYGPHRLAEVCDRASARLIHISTDCVFRGPGPHGEDDVPDADDIYAISKRAGEVKRPPHLTVRCSFVGFGRRGLLHDLQMQPAVRASRRLLWTGNTVDTVAELLVALAQRAGIAGLLHLPGYSMSRLELCQRLVEYFELETEIIEDHSFIADRRLACERWFDLGLPAPLPFEEQLRRMRREFV